MPNQFQNAAFPLTHQMKETSKPTIKSLKKIQVGLVRETNVKKQAKAKVKQTAQSSPRALPI